MNISSFKNRQKMNRMSKIMVVANWKMNPKTAKDAEALFEAVKEGIKGAKNVETVIGAPAIFLPVLGASVCKNSNGLFLGAQNCHWETQGKYTGEVSAPMLADAGAEYVILGHSERRKYMGETDKIVNLKIKAALKAELIAIICVGEQEGEEMGEAVSRQLVECLADISRGQLKDVIFVYEPVWAISNGIIGSGDACSPDTVFKANLLIKKILAGLFGRFLAEKVRVIYGGSVDAKNAQSFIKEAGMKGLLVGGASLNAAEFVKIVKSLDGL